MYKENCRSFWRINNSKSILHPILLQYFKTKKIYVSQVFKSKCISARIDTFPAEYRCEQFLVTYSSSAPWDWFEFPDRWIMDLWFIRLLRNAKDMYLSSHTVSFPLHLSCILYFEFLDIFDEITQENKAFRIS